MSQVVKKAFINIRSSDLELSLQHFIDEIKKVISRIWFLTDNYVKVVLNSSKLRVKTTLKHFETATDEINLLHCT